LTRWSLTRVLWASGFGTAVLGARTFFDQTDPTTRKRKRKWHSFKGDRKGALDECSRLRSEMKSGSYIEPSKITLASFFERWLKHIKPNVSPHHPAVARGRSGSRPVSRGGEHRAD
jgi:hypothetical protein